MATADYDVAVIGAGPGGYVCAIRCAQLGLKTACIDRRPAPGGTCLNIGCIPSKALLQSSELWQEAQGDLAGHGIRIASAELDLAAMMARKDKVVATLTKGVAGLLKKNRVTYVAGQARLLGGGAVAVGGRRLTAAHIVVATGSEAASLPGIAIDEKRILSSTGALALSQVPRRLAVIGGGYIGLELGSVWQRLGSEVTVVEFLDRIAAGMDGEIARQLKRSLEKQGIAFRLGRSLAAVKREGAGLKLTLAPAGKKGGQGESLACDAVLMAVGRRPHTAGLGLEQAGVECDERGHIAVDGRFATAAKGVFAIGDCVAGPMLAHKAEEEGIAVAENIAGRTGHVNYGVIPGVVYTEPEAAQLGKTEEELKAEGKAYAVGRFAMLANSRARAAGKTQGMVKVLADANSDRVLGVHILGQAAGELVAAAAIAMEFGASAEDIARTCHAHPTYSEALREAALDVAGRAVHG